MNKSNDTQPSDQTRWVTGQTNRFLDDFIKIKQLGRQGQYGVTYQCIRKSDEKSFAVKFINKNRCYDSTPKIRNRYLKMMQDEINILKALNHDNIIQLDDVYENDNRLYIIMEQCYGGELFQRLFKKGRYSEVEAANIMKQLLLSLRYMHDDKGIIHCDLKPDNILYVQKDTESIKIIDFGMSKFLPPLQYAKNECGTIHYMAPEIIENKLYNQSCDLWSVGIILYVLIYGYPPFYDYQEHSLRRKIVEGFQPEIKSTATCGYGPWFPDDIKVSEEVRDLISNLLQKQAHKRYTAKEALSHSWFLKTMGKNDEIDSIIISRLLRYNKDCPFKLVISTLFKNEFYVNRVECFERLHELFSKYGGAVDGVLSFEGFKTMIEAMEYINIDKKYLDVIYKRLGGSSIGIGFDELLDALVYDYVISCKQRLVDVFKKLDERNDGQVSMKQLKQKLMAIKPGEWDDVIELIQKQCVDPIGGFFWEEFLIKLHPNFEATPEWIPDLFSKMVSSDSKF